jgi:hypothetical protein
MRAEALVAGHELDALVAERVMGWKWCDVRLRGSTNTVRVLLPPRDGYWRQDGAHDERDFARAAPPFYSTEIRAAWEVVEALNERGFGVEVFRYGKAEGLEREWFVSIGDTEADADTAPLAICRAALKALDAASRS